MNEPPIQNLETIDLLGRRKNGGVDLIIVVSGPLQNEADHLDRLERKIAAYIRIISSDEFSEEFPRIEVSRRILLITEHAVSRAALSLLDSLRESAANAGAVLDIATPERLTQ
jgi:hypothetical protein